MKKMRDKRRYSRNPWKGKVELVCEQPLAFRELVAPAQPY